MRCLKCFYNIDHLEETRCPECGNPFNPGDARTYADDRRNYRRSVAIAGSFLGMFMGWAIARLLQVFYQVYVSGFHRTTDESFWLFWTSVVVLLWWLLFVVPLVLVEPVARRLSNPTTGVVGGALCGIAGYLVIISWVAGISWYMITFAAIVGAVTGLVTSFLLRRPFVRWAAPVPHGKLAVLWLAAPASMLAWVLVIWPVVCFYSSSMQYTFGDDVSKNEAVIRVLSQVHRGDPYDKLHYMLPRHFEQISPAANASWSARSGSSEYQVTVTNGIIQEVQYRSRGEH